MSSWTFLFIVHIPTQHGHMHTGRLKNLPATAPEVWQGRDRQGQGHRKLLLLSLPHGQPLHKKQESWGDCSPLGALGNGKGTLQAGAGSLRGATETIRRTLFLSLLGPLLNFWGGVRAVTAEKHRAPPSLRTERKDLFFFQFFFFFFLF